MAACGVQEDEWVLSAQVEARHVTKVVFGCTKRVVPRRAQGGAHRQHRYACAHGPDVYNSSYNINKNEHKVSDFIHITDNSFEQQNLIIRLQSCRVRQGDGLLVPLDGIDAKGLDLSLPSLGYSTSRCMPKKCPNWTETLKHCTGFNELQLIWRTEACPTMESVTLRPLAEV
ncbi:hypothetical protein ACQ4PT_057190 [Festuca glaucescens]